MFETIQRVHINEAVRSHAADLMRTLMLAMRKDNEENAVLAIRVIIELHKNFRSVPALEEYVQPFFDFVKEMLALVEDNVVAQIDECEDVTVAVCLLLLLLLSCCRHVSVHHSHCFSSMLA